MTLRGNIDNLLNDISGHVDHGECFYDEESFQDLCITIDVFKAACKDLYNSNQKEENA